MRLPLAAFAAALCCATPAAAQTIASVTTPFDLDKCKHTEGTEPEDYGFWQCKGYGGIPIYVAAGDQRTYISYGRNARNERAADETLASFNGEGKEIEWRGVKGKDGKVKPFATIMRWRTTVGAEDPPVEGEVLVVTRLPPGGACHIGYVDGKANSDALAQAQKIADDSARKFRCGKDKPVVSGNKGPGFSGPYGGRD